jgi:hypothetical protein
MSLFNLINNIKNYQVSKPNNVVRVESQVAYSKLKFSSIYLETKLNKFSSIALINISNYSTILFIQNRMKAEKNSWILIVQKVLLNCIKTFLADIIFFFQFKFISSKSILIALNKHETCALFFHVILISANYDVYPNIRLFKVEKKLIFLETVFGGLRKKSENCKYQWLNIELATTIDDPLFRWISILF